MQVRPIVAQATRPPGEPLDSFMFDKQHQIRVDTSSRLLRKIKRELSGFPLVGSIWNIAARATPSFRASDPIPGSGAFGWTTRRSSPAKLRRGRPQGIPSYGWSIKHWRSCRNRPPASGLVPSGCCCAESSRYTSVHSVGTNPHVPRDEFGLVVGEFLRWKIHFSFW